MSSSKKKEIPEYSLKGRKAVPHSFKWKVKDIFSNLEAWRKEKKRLLGKLEKIRDLAKDWTSSPEKMYLFLSHLDDVEQSEIKLYTYASLMSDTDMGNSTFLGIKGEIQTLAVNISTMLTFIEPDVLKMGKKKIYEFIKADARLTNYKFKFDSVLRLKKHILPADKAEIVVQTGLFSRAPEKASGILNDLDIPPPEITLTSGEKVPLNTSNYNRYRGAKNRSDRMKVMQTFWKNRAGYSNTLAILQDAAIKNHLFSARVHGYRNCLEASLYPNNISRNVYSTLIKTVKQNLRPLHRFLKLKARLLKIKEMLYEDVYASSVPTTERLFTFEEARNIIMEALQPLGNEYIEIVKGGFDSGWIDIYPNKGKRSGAYSNGSLYDIHPYILMNYNGTFRNLLTLAHELGHAMHSWFSNRNQPFVLAHYPIFLAEIASTFNENLLIEYLKKTETDDQFKLYILDQYLEGLRGTLYRQTLFADFELKMHQHVEKGKTLTPQWLNKTYLHLTRLYYGHKEGIIKVGKYIMNEWSGIPHFYYNFYVYQYSTGIVASTALADMVLKGGKSERLRYLNFLQSGGCKYPLEILEVAGVDLTTSHPIEITISRFNETLNEMEKIIKNR